MSFNWSLVRGHASFSPLLCSLCFTEGGAEALLWISLFLARQALHSIHALGLARHLIGQTTNEGSIYMLVPTTRVIRISLSLVPY